MSLTAAMKRRMMNVHDTQRISTASDEKSEHRMTRRKNNEWGQILHGDAENDESCSAEHALAVRHGR